MQLLVFGDGFGFGGAEVHIGLQTPFFFKKFSLILKNIKNFGSTKPPKVNIIIQPNLFGMAHLRLALFP